MKIKRFFITVLVVVLMLSAFMSALTACGTKGECEGCGEEATLKSVDLGFLGKLDLCSDCADELADDFKDFN